MPDELSVGGDKLDVQFLCEGDVLAVVHRARRAREQLQDSLATERVLVGSKKPLRQFMRLPCVGNPEPALPHVARENTAKLAAPENGRGPGLILFKHPLGEIHVRPAEQEIGDEIDVNDDQARPACRAVRSWPAVRGRTWIRSRNWRAWVSHRCASG